MINANVIDDYAIYAIYEYAMRPILICTSKTINSQMIKKNCTLWCSTDVWMEPMSMIIHHERWKQANYAFQTNTVLWSLIIRATAKYCIDVRIK